MKRMTLFIGAIAALGTTAANADNRYPFDDPYWKRPDIVMSAPAVQSAPDTATQAKGPYDLVDNYNP
jgi:hypothetical protein